ncbi:MFS transporter [Streptomyces sp. NPDC002669]|uniref:MFS transporter n=1 Tax=Streptomyces sp. NPDC002669 TaxID=3364658 RepID=UPI0036B495B6
MRVSSPVGRWSAATLASLLGAQIFHVVLAWSVLRVSGPMSAAVVLALGTLPRIAMMTGLTAGLAARFAPLRLAPGGELVRAVLALGAAAVLAAGTLDFTALLVASVAFGLVEAVTEPGTGGLPALVAGPADQQRMQTLRTTLFRATVVLGGPLAGLSALLGLSTALIVNAAVFVVSAAVFALLRPLPADPSAPAGAMPGPGGMPGMAGPPGPDSLKLGEALALPGVRAALICTVLIELGCPGAFNVGTLLLADHRGWGVTGFGVLVGAVGLGTVAAALAPSFARRLRGSGMGLILACLLTAAAMAGLSWAPNLPVAAVLTVVMALTAAAASAATLGVLFSGPRPEAMGMVMGTVMAAGALAAPLSYLAVGAVARGWGPAPALLGCAGALTAAALVGLADRSLRTATAPEMPAGPPMGPPPSGPDDPAGTAPADPAAATSPTGEAPAADPSLPDDTGHLSAKGA